MPLPQTPPAQAFSRDRFAVRASRLGVISRKFSFYDDAGNCIAFAKLNDSRVLSHIDVLDGTRQQAILWIRERVPSSPVTYDLFDPANGEKIGALRHCPWRSLFKNEWIILDSCDCELGRLRQNSALAALLQHSLIFMPIKYGFYVGDSPLPHVDRMPTLLCLSSRFLSPSVRPNWTADLQFWQPFCCSSTESMRVISLLAFISELKSPDAHQPKGRKEVPWVDFVLF